MFFQKVSQALNFIKNSSFQAGFCKRFLKVEFKGKINMCINKSERVVYMAYIERHMWLCLMEGGIVARHQGPELAQQPGCAPTGLQRLQSC